MKKPNKLFVYGILVPDADQPAVLENYEHFFRGFASIRYKEGSKVEGGLIEDVSDVDFERYDLIEGVAMNYYHRFVVEVQASDGNTYDAWVYQQVVDKDDKAEQT